MLPRRLWMQERQGIQVHFFTRSMDRALRIASWPLKPSASQKPVWLAQASSPFMTTFGQQWGFHPEYVPHAISTIHTKCDEADLTPSSHLRNTTGSRNKEAVRPWAILGKSCFMASLAPKITLSGQFLSMHERRGPVAIPCSSFQMTPAIQAR